MFKTFLAIFLGKIIFFLSRFLKIGGGFAAPGLYALKIDPDLVSKLTQKIQYNIIITGTNGKTTTASMLSFLFNSKDILRNVTGSNLERGIASTLIRHFSVFGETDKKIAVWEVDEAAFNTVAPKINPNLVVFLNVYRDQLDRYGEIDQIVKQWSNTLKKLSKKTQLLINANDGNLEPLIKLAPSKVSFFSAKTTGVLSEKKFKAKKDSQFQAVDISKNLLEGIQFIFIYGSKKIPIKLSLPGDFNVLNATAALSAKFLSNDLTVEETQSLINFKASFGRFERFKYKGKDCYIFLIKNPIGATEVLATISPNLKENDTLLLILNDNFADGRDVSWIWDIGLENFQFSILNFHFFVSGTRSLDMALRLKYAGLTNLRIEPDLPLAIEKAATGTQGRLFILPTYTALLELQKVLVKKGIKKHYWKE